MGIGYLWLTLVLLILISSMILYFKNRQWEDLLENKQKEFDVKSKINKRSSVIYQKVVAFASITMFVSVIGGGNMGLFDFKAGNSFDDTQSMYGVESSERGGDNLEALRCDNIVKEWTNVNQAYSNLYLSDYSLGHVAEDNENFVYMESFDLTICDIHSQADIYQLDNEYYVYLSVVEQFYQLELKK